MRHLRPAIDEAEALRRWHAPPTSLLGKLVRAFAPRPAPDKIELVWLPAYLVTIPLESRTPLDDAVCSIDGLSASFAIFQMHALLQDGSVTGDSFPPTVAPEDAEYIARSSLIVTILRRRGRAGKPVPGPTRSVEPLLWPYWVYYHSRRGGRMDVQLLDAATGDRPGHKIKLGLLEAFRAQARAQSQHSEGNQRG